MKPLEDVRNCISCATKSHSHRLIFKGERGLYNETTVYLCEVQAQSELASKRTVGRCCAAHAIKSWANTQSPLFLQSHCPLLAEKLITGGLDYSVKSSNLFALRRTEIMQGPIINKMHYFP